MTLKKFHEYSLKRDFAEAERTLMEIKEKIPNSSWNQGYILALEGMLAANRIKDDKSSFFNRILSNKSSSSRSLELIKSRTQDSMSPDLDRGFFAAWSDFTDLLKRPKTLDSFSNNYRQKNLSNND